MNFQPLGPAGVNQRIQEIRAQIEQAFGPSFDATLQSATVSGISGNIGGLIGNPTDLLGGNQPLNPFDGGLSLHGKAPADIKTMIQKAANEAGIDENLFDALISAESSYNPQAVSRAGAKGLAQLMDGTAKELGVTNPFDPAQSLKGGAEYLRKMMVKFGDVRLALAAYNAGPGAVQKAGGIPDIPETRAYVDRIMALYHGGRSR